MFTSIANRAAFIQWSFSLSGRALIHAGNNITLSSIGLDTPAFQRHLKQLKLQLHPDRVATHPEARAANEQSFKVLSQYIDELRGDGGNPAEQYRLDFYMKRDSQTRSDWQDLTVNESTLHASARFLQDPRYWRPGQEVFEPTPGQEKPRESENTGATNEQPAEQPLRRLTMRLPPPPPHAASRLPAAIRRAFRRLFSALQLDDIFIDDESIAVDHSKREVTAVALADFLPDAIEVARQGESVRHSLPSQQLQSIQSAFWMARRMRIVFDGAADTQTPSARIALLEALGRALDRSGNNALRDCTVTVGEGTGLDVLGRVWLPYDQETAWPDVLAAVDVGLVWERRRQFDAVREMEASAARAVGVATIFSSHRLSLSRAYLDFLQRLEDYGAASGQVCGGDMALLSLCALPAPDMPEMRLLREVGVVQVSVGSCATAVAAYVAAQGPNVADSLQRQLVAKQSLKDLRRRVELRLRLQQLTHSPQISAEEFENGCHLMLAHREFLVKYLEGSAVELSDRNCIIPGQHIISIAWNFQMEVQDECGVR